MIRKLLVVDDNTDLLFAMQKLISFYDFTVRTSSDDKTMWEEVAKFQPDIVILDVSLSGLDGKSLCKLLRDNPLNRAMVIILFSVSPKSLLNFQECGADGIIEKPFGIKDFLEKVEQAISVRKNILANTQT